MAKVIIYSPQPIGKTMAGSAIRGWEFAKHLSPFHQVILIAPSVENERTEVKCLSIRDPACKKHFEDADVLIAQRLTIPLARLASAHGVKVIIDAYDPSPLELLELYRRVGDDSRRKHYASEIATLAFSFKMAGGILCASEKQRDLWMGFLMANRLISPQLYDGDPSLRDFIEVVPFGMPSTPPQKKGMGLREKLGLKLEDKILLWGGGIWNWFDPLTLLKAMQIVGKQRNDIKLVFMGCRTPDPNLPEMWMAQEALQMAQRLNLIDRNVYFHGDWVPYDERQNFLLDADIGVSTHFDHLETHFSFRTRILDYLWAQLPVIATEGDAFAELICRHNLGHTVPPQDGEALATAILDLVNDRDKLVTIKKNIARLQEQFYWKSVIIPLQNMLERMVILPKEKKEWFANRAIASFVKDKVKAIGFAACMRKAYALLRS